MGFVPMQFRESDAAVLKTHVGHPLHFAPSAGTVNLFEPGDLADRLADGDRLDILDLADDLEMHPCRL